MTTERFVEALAYATRLHAEQKRKGSEVPYVAHLLAVAAMVLENGADEDEAIAALLHDAVEDQGGDPTRQEIRRRFGDRVARIVDECTDADFEPKPPWRERKERFLEQLRTASPSARLVSACDKLHNARSVLDDLERQGNATWKRFRGGREGTLWYYRAVADELARGEEPKPAAVAELCRVVNQLEARAAALGPDAGASSGDRRG